MFCPQCGNNVPDNVPFCPQCGRKLTAEKTSASSVTGSTPYGSSTALSSSTSDLSKFTLVIVALCANIILFLVPWGRLSVPLVFDQSFSVWSLFGGMGDLSSLTRASSSGDVLSGVLVIFLLILWICSLLVSVVSLVGFFMRRQWGLGLSLGAFTAATVTTGIYILVINIANGMINDSLRSSLSGAISGSFFTPAWGLWFAFIVSIAGIILVVTTRKKLLKA